MVVSIIWIQWFPHYKALVLWSNVAECNTRFHFVPDISRQSESVNTSGQQKNDRYWTLSYTNRSYTHLHNVNIVYFYINPQYSCQYFKLPLLTMLSTWSAHLIFLYLFKSISEWQYTLIFLCMHTTAFPNFSGSVYRMAWDRTSKRALCMNLHARKQQYCYAISSPSVPAYRHSRASAEICVETFFSREKNVIN